MASAALRNCKSARLFKAFLGLSSLIRAGPLRQASWGAGPGRPGSSRFALYNSETACPSGLLHGSYFGSRHGGSIILDLQTCWCIMYSCKRNKMLGGVGDWYIHLRHAVQLLAMLSISRVALGILWFHTWDQPMHSLNFHMQNTIFFIFKWKRRRLQFSLRRSVRGPSRHDHHKWFPWSFY